jgi:hypothetical protein
VTSVAEQHNLYAAPYPSKSFDEVPATLAPAPILSIQAKYCLCSMPNEIIVLLRTI